MSEALSQGLLITLIGMGLVFLALILLWWLMDLMVRIRLPKRKESEEAGEEEALAANVEEATGNELGALRARAAAAAVAAALGIQAARVHLAPPAGQSLSPWQAVRRSGQINQSAKINSRKV
jgi:sodium pump decarboxylase gamma subunit